MGRDVPGAWLGAAGVRRRKAAASSHHQPSMGPWPHPRRGQAEEGPFDSRRRARERGLLFQRSAVCTDGAPCAPRWGLCFSWLGMCSALLASAGRGGPHWGPLLPVGPRPRAKQGLLQDHLLHSCGRRERWEMCPELISWLSHAGATSVLLPLGVGRGVPGCPQGWQLTSEGSGLHTAGHPPVLHYGSWGAPVCTPAHA